MPPQLSLPTGSPPSACRTPSAQECYGQSWSWPQPRVLSGCAVMPPTQQEVLTLTTCLPTASGRSESRKWGGRQPQPMAAAKLGLPWFPREPRNSAPPTRGRERPPPLPSSSPSLPPSHSPPPPSLPRPPSVLLLVRTTEGGRVICEDAKLNTAIISHMRQNVISQGSIS